MNCRCCHLIINGLAFRIGDIGSNYVCLTCVETILIDWISKHESEESKPN